MNLPRMRSLALALGAAAAGLIPASPTAADTPQQFYAKAKVKMIIGTAVGGSYDLMGRLAARHLRNQLPGKPAILVQNMPGGGSLIATNYLYNVAPQDGSVLGAVVPGIILTALYGEKSARYDPTKLNWIGYAMDAVAVPTVFHTSPVKTLAEMKSKQVVMGAGGISSMDASNARLFNALLGTKIKLVTGYKGGDAINLAMERGEVNGRASQAWAAWKAVRPQWIRDDKLIPLLQVSLAPVDDPKLKGVPLLIDLVKGEEERKIARAYTAVATIGRPVLMGPGVPKDRVAFMRGAYAAMVKDPAFLADAKKQRINLKPMDGASIQALVEETFALDKKLVARLKSIVYRKRSKKKRNK
ncbi:MAG: tripartite tricarboxylate transporter substrate-binding protein [Alphaproteobacteria bacterium]|nr:tripartite tricarboxylate transporter substrate-binding protein [Alphaproteobacteria bacterium]